MLKELYDIVDRCTVRMAAGSDFKPWSEGAEYVDCHFVRVAVHVEEANKAKAELLALLGQAEWPKGREISYMEAGELVGDQGMAFQIFALGQVLGLWRVLTPKLVLGDRVPETLLEHMAGQGFITTSGFAGASL